jgi:hypothetical protein
LKDTFALALPLDGFILEMNVFEKLGGKHNHPY